MKTLGASRQLRHQLGRSTRWTSTACGRNCPSGDRCSDRCQCSTTLTSWRYFSIGEKNYKRCSSRCLVLYAWHHSHCNVMEHLHVLSRFLPGVFSWHFVDGCEGWSGGLNWTKKHPTDVEDFPCRLLATRYHLARVRLKPSQWRFHGPFSQTPLVDVIGRAIDGSCY